MLLPAARRGSVCGLPLCGAACCCGAGWNPARRLSTGARGGLPIRRRFPTCPTGFTLNLMIPAGLKQRVHDLLGPRGYLDRPQDLALYEYDGGIDKHAPDLVAFPRTTAEVAALVTLAQEFSVPFVGRGAGTGLSGGAIPREGGLMIAFARMNRILELDLENERVVVQPGVVNLDITLAVQGSGYFYAPDPSSQRACTIGGNVAENAGALAG